MNLVTFVLILTMQIISVINELESIVPLSLQEDYDNCGLLTGSPHWDCKDILISLDINESVLEEAIQRGCNLIISHHPILFRGIKKITGATYVERCLIKAIKSDIAIYAIHTNLDNVQRGVNGAIADRLSLNRCKVLLSKPGQLKKLVFFVPPAHTENVKSAIFKVGGGQLGNYAECSFSHEGTGSFLPLTGAAPFSGSIGARSVEKEDRVEIHFPAWLEKNILKAMKEAHPYEEVAYDLIPLTNTLDQIGAGLVGLLPEPLSEKDFLSLLKQKFGLKTIRHTGLNGKIIRKVALCGGAGAGFIHNALKAGADAYITSDLKYHDFFEADNRLLLTDIGHWESEQFTVDLLVHHLMQKFPTFAVLKTNENTNPVHYFL